MIRSPAGFVVAVAVFMCALSAWGATYVVKPDGTGDFPTIQAAIDASVDGDFVELTDGTFTGHGNRDIHYLGKAITVRSQSGDPQSCTIDCEGSLEEPHRGFIFQSGENSASVLEGVTVTNGFANWGGGVYCRDFSSPSLTNCVFSGNLATVWGGGVYCDVSAPTITNCTFSEDSAYQSGGGLFCVDSAPTITGCTFSSNSTYGPGGTGGGVYSHNSSPSLASCTLSGNSSRDGGGIMCFGEPSPSLTNCTLSGNSAGRYGGGMACFVSSAPTLENTIIAFSTEGEAVYCGTGSSATLACCDVYGNVGGDWVGCIADQYGVNGNISEDPLFCNPDNDNFTLHADSPCAPFSPPNPECDLIGAWPVRCGTTLALHPSRIATYYPCDDSYSVDLWVHDVSDLGAFETCSGFDSTLVALEGVVVDDFLGSTGRDVYPLGPISCDPSCQVAGVKYGAWSVGEEDGPSGSGSLARVSFFRLGDWAAADTICLEDWMLVDTQLPPRLIQVGDVSGAAVAHRDFCYGDFDDDGEVTTLDIMQVVARWGCCVDSACYTDSFDVNLIEEGNYCASVADSCIDVVDVQEVAGRWGQGCPGEGGRIELPPEVPETVPVVRICPDTLDLCCVPGDTASFSLLIEGAFDLGAFEAHLSFDPSVVHVEDVLTGDFLGRTGRSVYPLGPSIDNESGSVLFGAWTIGENPGSEGSGTLARVILSMASCGEATALDLTEVTITDTNGWPQTLGEVFDGLVQTDCSSDVPERSRVLPMAFALNPATPNPVGPRTKISFAIPGTAGQRVPVEVVIYDICGRAVRRLVEGYCGPGNHHVVWEGDDREGRPVASGIYFCRFQAGDYRETRRLTVLK